MLAACSAASRLALRRCLSSPSITCELRRYYSTKYALHPRSQNSIASDHNSSSNPSDVGTVDTVDAPPSTPNKRKEKARSQMRDTSTSKKRARNRKGQPLVPSGPRPPSRLEEHMESITDGMEPTLQDLERFKPEFLRLLRRTNLVAYESLYNDTALAVGRSFTRFQLGEMLDQLLPKRSTSPLRKRDMVKLILGQHWEMPHPADEERKRKDLVEVRTRAIPVSSAELFLLLGKDGTEFKEMAAKFRTRLYVDRSPLAIRAEGLELDLIDLAKYIDEFKLNIFREEMQVNIDHLLPDNLVQSISRLAGALVENPKIGEIVITANDHRKASTARRLIIRASMEEVLSHRSPLFAHTSSSDEPYAQAYLPPYALYPYVSSSPLPWTMGTSSGFRPRRIGEWLLGHKIGTVQSLDGEGSITTTDGSSVLDLRTPLLGSELLSNNSGSISITASSGHVIMTTPGSSRTASLVPPIPGSWSFQKALDWLREKRGRGTFVPSPPPPLLKSTPSHDAELVRLRYRHIPTIKGYSTTDLPVSPLVGGVLICELPVSRILVQSNEGENISSLMNIRLGNEARVDLILPERPMDLQFLVSDLQTLANEDIPRPLHQFCEDFVRFLLTDEVDVATVSQPTPPTTISLYGISYDLECSLDVRRSTQQLETTKLTSPSGGDWPEPGDAQKRMDEMEESPLVPITCESILDLESNERRSACLVHCRDPRNDVLWREFLHRCDRLSLHAYPVIPAGQRAPALSSTVAKA